MQQVNDKNSHLTTSFVPPKFSKQLDFLENYAKKFERKYWYLLEKNIHEKLFTIKYEENIYIF